MKRKKIFRITVVTLVILILSYFVVGYIITSKEMARISGAAIIPTRVSLPHGSMNIMKMNILVKM